MPDEQNRSHTSPFDAIRKVDEQGREYWSARDLGKLLGYKTNYRNFQTSINNAKTACETSGQAISDHFAQVRKQIKGGKGAVQIEQKQQPSLFDEFKEPEPGKE